MGSLVFGSPEGRTTELKRQLHWDESSTDIYSAAFPPEASKSHPKSSEHSKKDGWDLENLAPNIFFRIRLFRLVVVSTLLIAGVISSTLTYKFLRQEEQDNFANTYFSFCDHMQDTTRFRVQNTIQASRGLSETLTAYAKSSKSTFPFVTMPMFEVAGKNARHLSGIDVFGFLPFVDEDQKNSWEVYALEKSSWLDESRDLYNNESGNETSGFTEAPFPLTITQFTSDFGTLKPAVLGQKLYTPVHQVTPPPLSNSLQNLDFITLPSFARSLEAITALKDVVFSDYEDVDLLARMAYPPDAQDTLAGGRGSVDYDASPRVYMHTPVYSQLSTDDEEIVGVLSAPFAFDLYLQDLLPKDIKGIHAILESSCNKWATFELIGERAVYLGLGDRHDPQYDHMEVAVEFTGYGGIKTENIPGQCVYTLRFYPTRYFEITFNRNTKIIAPAVAAATFFWLTLVFFLYDRYVQQRTVKAIDTAARSGAAVASRYPSRILTRLFEEASDRKGCHASQSTSLNHKPTLDWTDGCSIDHPCTLPFKTKPIAEFFPTSTVMFADIVGFTVWSSGRKPEDVFTVLETLYHAFDKISKNRGVLKVETVGDCYVAVSGLTNQQENHAVIMGRLARECMHTAHALTKQLSLTLGSDTAELSLRIGIHSGPVTAGVLRCERSPFQLFGDTINVASRMERSGRSGRIQISEETADKLTQAGKTDWIIPREDALLIDGKGELKTYWLFLGNDDQQWCGSSSNLTRSVSYTTRDEDTGDSVYDDLFGTSVGGASESLSKVGSLTSDKMTRLISWNVDVLTLLLKEIAASRRPDPEPGRSTASSRPPLPVRTTTKASPAAAVPGRVLDEVKEILSFPLSDAASSEKKFNEGDVELEETVLSQLRVYVTNIAAMYRNHHFHNFAHASHVVLCMTKMLSNIVAPGDAVNGAKHPQQISRHDHTFGITSDPLTRFACVFSALIHDVDHCGVPNTQLVQEKARIASFYRNKSVAEQNSVDLAWELMLDENFAELRAAICMTRGEQTRFRQLVVNAVMATDVMDPDFKLLRNARWERAFWESRADATSRETINRKATLVLDYLMQAADVAHTMQHWHVYRQWSERFFQECYTAFRDGRAEHNPAEIWYYGELNFFDFYIIPLAKKLKVCGVFGGSGGEYLNYALKNRKNWERTGREVVQEMVRLASA